MKVQAESFHLIGYIIGFRPQTQKLESPYKNSIKHSGSERVNFLEDPLSIVLQFHHIWKTWNLTQLIPG